MKEESIPTQTYIFKQPSPEGGHDSILTKKKKQIHERIAGTIEDIYKEDIFDILWSSSAIALPVRITRRELSMHGWRQKDTRKTGSFMDAMSMQRKV